MDLHCLSVAIADFVIPVRFLSLPNPSNEVHYVHELESPATEYDGCIIRSRSDGLASRLCIGSPGTGRLARSKEITNRR